MPRVFIALDLVREAINEIKRIQEILEKKNIFLGKLTEPENLHLTLKFLGEIDEGKIEQIKSKLKEIKFPEFEAKLSHFGLFSESFPRILWIKLEGRGVFDLQKSIDEKLTPSFVPEARFMSHITLARIKKIPNKADFLDYIKSIKPKKIKFKIKEFSLKKSELKPEGPVYSDLEGFQSSDSDKDTGK